MAEARRSTLCAAEAAAAAEGAAAGISLLGTPLSSDLALLLEAVQQPFFASQPLEEPSNNLNNQQPHGDGDEPTFQPHINACSAQIVRDLPIRAHELARIFERLGQREDALQYYKMAMNADGAYLENLIAYGRLLVDMGRWDRALRVYQSLLMQQQNLPDGDAVKEMLLNLATTCHELGMTGQAQQHIKRLLELDPEHGPGLALRSRLV